MKKLLIICAAAFTAVAYGGTATRTFEWYRNAAQTDFQVPIVLEEGVGGFSYSEAAADGSDLCVFSGGTQLPVEIENWNTSGKSVAWVKVPSFSKDTTLTLKWGEDADPSPLRDNLWSNARLVMHLADGKDSSTFGASFSRSENATTDGPVGAGSVLGTEARKYNCASMANGQIANMGSNFTISFWLNSANLGSNNGSAVNQYLFVGMVPGGQFAILHGYKAGYLELYFDGWCSGTNPRAASGLPIVGEGWHHYAWTYDGTTLKAYRDGSQYSSTSISFTLKTSTSSHAFRLGGAGSSAYLSGSLDELRIESVARSANWIAAECETQSQVLCPYIELELSDCAVGETLTDFTALVAMDYNDARWDVDFHVAARNEALTFRLPDGTVCPHETERATLDSGAPCRWWVKIPECAAGQKLRICRPFASVPSGSMIYQNPSAWGDDYMHVFHLSPLPTRYDATGRGIIKAGADTPWAWTNYCGAADGPTGPLLGMKTADKTVAYVGYGVVPPSFSNRYTVAFWARKDDFDNPKDSYVFAFLKDGGSQASLVAGYGGHNRNAFRLYDGTYDSAGAELVIPDGGWHHYAFVSDGAALKGYRDGELAFTSSNIFSFRYAGGPLNFWVGGASNGNNAFIGALDEFSIAYEPRSAGWISACYRNQNAYRHGTVRHYAPSFARDVAAVSGNNGLAFAADLVCKQSANVTLCWGAADGGETLGGWANARSLGSLSEGELNEVVASLADDQRVCARFYAENASGSAWSLPIWGRMPSAKAQYYAKVAFTGYEGTSTLTNFTACVRLPSRLCLPATSGSIRFTTDDGEPLPFEVETWNPAGESVVWVKVPRLTAATVLKVWWGGVDTTGDLSSGGTAWDSSYMRVYHFSGVADSSIEGTATTAATLANYGAAESPAGAGLTFNNQACFFLPTKKLDLAEGLTLQLWAKITSTTPSYVTVALNDNQVGFVHGYNGDNVECFVSDPLPNDYGGALSALRLSSLLPRRDGEWHHYAYTLDGRRFASYLDGVQVTNVPFQVAIGANPNFMKPKAPLYFGSAPSGSAKMTGALDEYRMEKVGRSADWIRACWKNQATDTFCTVSGIHGLGFMVIVQ